ncbi:proteasome 26S subunit, non-ATPase 6, partial [Homo sapiens]
MPLENLEEEGLPKNPDLRIAQLRFLLSLPEHRGDAAVRDELMAAVRDNNFWNRIRQEQTEDCPPSSPSRDMAPYYEALCKSLDWQIDVDLLNKMKKANEDELKRLDEELEDAEKNLGESEIRDAMMAKAEYLCRIGDKEGALTA